MEGCVASPALHVDCHSCLCDQEIHYIVVTICSSQVQRCFAPQVHSRGIGAVVQQQINNLHVVVFNGDVQRTEAVICV